LASAALEASIATKVQSILSNWIGVTINVIIESLVCEGITTNTEIIDREIQSLMHDAERVVNAKVELSDYYATMLIRKSNEIAAASAAITAKTKNLDRILMTMRGTGTDLIGRNITKAIYDNMAINYDMNMLNILEELVLIGNRTFPY
jgi:hypothetical protein